MKNNFTKTIYSEIKYIFWENNDSEHWLHIELKVYDAMIVPIYNETSSQA